MVGPEFYTSIEKIADTVINAIGGIALGCENPVIHHHLLVPVMVKRRSGLPSTVGPPKSILMNCTGAWLMRGARSRFGELMWTCLPTLLTVVALAASPAAVATLCGTLLLATPRVCRRRCGSTGPDKEAESGRCLPGASLERGDSRRALMGLLGPSWLWQLTVKERRIASSAATKLSVRKWIGRDGELRGCKATFAKRTLRRLLLSAMRGHDGTVIAPLIGDTAV